MEYRYTGIILNKRDVGESDRIYTIYTLEDGKINSLAKGVRKSQAKLAGFLENFTLTNLIIVRARGLGKITGSIVENNFVGIRNDYSALIEVFSSLSIFDKIIGLENSDEKIFFLLREYLEIMNETALKKDENKYEIISLGFIVKLMDLLGYAIEVNSCVACSGKLSGDNICLSPKHGGVLCYECGKNTQSFCMVRKNGIKLLRLFFGNNLSSLMKIKIEKADIDSVKVAINNFLLWSM